MKTMSLRLPDDLHEALVKLAEDKERSLNQQIVYLLRQSLKKPGDQSSANASR